MTGKQRQHRGYRIFKTRKITLQCGIIKLEGLLIINI